MPVFKRPTTCDEGIEQLRRAVQETPPKQLSGGHPRTLLWKACNRMMQGDFVEHGLKVLYDKNQIVSFLFNTIVPHIEERLRYATLEDEHAKAMLKPENVTQNTARFQAMIDAVKRADDGSMSRKVDDQFRRMRTSMRPLCGDAEVVDGLRVLYTSSKIARKSLDLIFERLIKTFTEDSSIVATHDIPLEAMFLQV